MNAQQVREIIKEFGRDWIPFMANHGHVIEGVRNIRPAVGLERCCACGSYDIQSGRIYCGDLADIVADVTNLEGCIVAYCKRHSGRMDDHKKE